MTFTDDIPRIFESESKKLEILLDTADSRADMDLHEIIATYYQVLSVSSMVTMLRQQASFGPGELMDKIQQTQNMISERFDSVIHPEIMAKLSKSVQDLTNNLQSEKYGQKSKEQTKLDANLFDELRQTMSTKEFVKQYENGISHD